jgi:hypothetical protein
MADQNVFAGVHEVTISPPDHTEDQPGLVVRWRRRGDVWEALVTHEVDGGVVTEWLPALVLAPQAAS